LSFGAFAKLNLSKFEEAVATLRRALDIGQNYPQTHFWLAMALAELGQVNEARAAAQAGLALNPTYTISRVRARPRGDDPAYLAQRERLIDDLRKAGVPEE